MPSSIRMLVLDVLKPLEPSIIRYSQVLADIEEIEGVNISVVEVDRQTETIKVSLVGQGIDVKKLTEAIQELGGTVHSIDKVAAGRRIIEEVPTGSSHE